MRVGEAAPDFQLPLHTGDYFQLSAYRGKQNVVLYFYPKDFTSGCTKEGCLFSSHVEDIVRLGAIIVGISADTLESHRNFAKDFHLAFPLASDLQKHVCRVYGALWILGIAVQRVTYVIDTLGIVRGRFRHGVQIHRHWDDVLNLLRDLEQKNARP